jgi:DNA-directed RNA polymerase sigma subunit (sigma70/sigma32)
MHDPATDDDTLADAVADALIERAMSDPSLRRIALRAAGLAPGPAKHPADMTAEELAAAHGVTTRRIYQLQSDTMLRLKNDPKARQAFLALQALRNRQP